MDSQSSLDPVAPPSQDASSRDEEGLACSPFFGPPHKGDCLENLNANIDILLHSLLNPPSVARFAELSGRRVAK